MKFSNKYLISTFLLLFLCSVSQAKQVVSSGEEQSVKKEQRGKGKKAISQAIIFAFIGDSNLYGDPYLIDNVCSLSEAIMNANLDGPVHPDCAPGNGADIIQIVGFHPFNFPSVTGDYRFPDPFGSDSALPMIETNITIEGAGFNIQRFPNISSPDFRIFHVNGPNAFLTLKDIGLLGGDVSAIGQNGGGILVENYGRLALERTYVGDSRAYNGGGIWIAGNGLNSSGVDGFMMTGSAISGNRATNKGGGIGIENASSNINNSIINQNHSAIGGGIFMEYGAFHAEKINLTGNTATVHAGGIAANFVADLNISDFNLIENASYGATGAGGAYLNGSTFSISNGAIVGNTVEQLGTAGMAIWSSSGLVENVTVAENEARFFGPISNIQVGGVRISDTSAIPNSVKLQNVTITGNESNWVGGLFINAPNTLVEIHDSLIVGNGLLSPPVMGTELFRPSTANLLFEGTVIGRSGITTNEAINGVFDTNNYPSNRTATSNGTHPMPLSGILENTLDYNGGNSLNRLLVAGSPAIDTRSCADTQVFIDQRGAARSGLCDSGATEWELSATSELSLSGIILEESVDTANSMIATTLSDGGLVPVEEPYTGLGYIYPQNIGTVISSVSNNQDVVDWVVVELRDSNDISLVIAAQPGLLMRDTKIYAEDGVSPISFDSTIVPDGYYYVVIHHRNHIGLASSYAVLVQQGNNNFTYAASGAIYGGAAGYKTVTLDNGTSLNVIVAGDATGDGTVDASDRSATWNDRNHAGYLDSDVTLDGVVDSADRDRAWENRNWQRPF